MSPIPGFVTTGRRGLQAHAASLVRGPAFPRGAHPDGTGAACSGIPHGAAQAGPRDRRGRAEEGPGPQPDGARPHPAPQPLVAGCWLAAVGTVGVGGGGGGQGSGPDPSWRVVSIPIRLGAPCRSRSVLARLARRFDLDPSWRACVVDADETGGFDALGAHPSRRAHHIKCQGWNAGRSTRTTCRVWGHDARQSARGHIVGMVMVRGMGKRNVSAIDPATYEQRLSRSWRARAVEDHVVFDVVASVCLGTFLGAESNLPADAGQLLPCCHRREYQIQASSHAAEVLRLTAMCAASLQDPCGSSAIPPPPSPPPPNVIVSWCLVWVLVGARKSSARRAEAVQPPACMGHRSVHEFGAYYCDGNAGGGG